MVDSCQVIAIGNLADNYIQNSETKCCCQNEKKSFDQASIYDLQNISQKCCLWNTIYGFPEICIVLGDINQKISTTNDEFREKACTYFCIGVEDNWHQKLDLKRLSSYLTKSKPVFVQSYIQNECVYDFCMQLKKLGFEFAESYQLEKSTYDSVNFLSKCYLSNILLECTDCCAVERPEYYIAEDKKKLMNIVRYLEGEFVVKGAYGSGGYSVSKFNTDDDEIAKMKDFEEFFQLLCLNHPSDFFDFHFPLVIEKYINYDYSITVDVQLDNIGGICWIIGCVRLSDHCFYQGVIGGIEVEEQIQVFCARFGKRIFDLGFRGCFNVDFLFCNDSEMFHVVEANLRPSAVFDLTSNLTAEKFRIGVCFDYAFLKEHLSLDDITYTVDSCSYLNNLKGIVPSIGAFDIHWCSISLFSIYDPDVLGFTRLLDCFEEVFNQLSGNEVYFDYPPFLM
eukprot:TRINITY_DN1953_c0_g1_i1.p1 TRINITY_DN1953_c0_g1~~TRINITY_DN1953_c0_g1_i1.p1  ORF type:complete len:461 (-),score=111.28 TRINITY_DN1953_c0_g1_i1:374-1726(-)